MSVSVFQASGKLFEQHRRDIADVRNNAADIAASSHEGIREELGGMLQSEVRRHTDADKIVSLIERKLARDTKLSYPEIMGLLEDRVLSVSGEAEWHANISNILSVIKTGLPDLIWAGIYFVNGDVLELGHGTGYVGMAVLPNGHGMCGTVAATGIPIRVPDTARWRGRINVDHAAKSELAVPLYSKEKVIGVLCLESPKLERFTEEDETGCLEIAALLERWHARHGKIYKTFSPVIDATLAIEITSSFRADHFMADTAIDLNAAADRLGVSRKDILRAMEREAATARTEEGINGFAGLSPPQIMAVVEDSTLGRLRRRYEALLTTISLPPDGFTTIEEARKAALLVTTLQNLHERQVRLGLEPQPMDDRVREAARLRTAFYRKRQKHRTC